MSSLGWLGGAGIVAGVRPCSVRTSSPEVNELWPCGSNIAGPAFIALVSQWSMTRRWAGRDCGPLQQ